MISHGLQKVFTAAIASSIAGIVSSIAIDNRAPQVVVRRDTLGVSSWHEFLYYRPSQMPAASGHSLGNANLVKAKALFDFLRDRVLPSLVIPPAAQ